MPMLTLVLEEESERVKVSVISTDSSFMTTLARLKHVLLVVTVPAGMMRVLCVSVKSWTAVQCININRTIILKKVNTSTTSEQGKGTHPSKHAIIISLNCCTRLLLFTFIFDRFTSPSSYFKSPAEIISYLYGNMMVLANTQGDE